MSTKPQLLNSGQKPRYTHSGTQQDASSGSFSASASITIFHAARVSGVKVAGKTGTAEASASQVNSLFVGFAPYDQPTIAVSICLENEDTGTASAVAGSVIAACLNVQAMGASS